MVNQRHQTGLVRLGAAAVLAVALVASFIRPAAAQEAAAVLSGRVLTPKGDAAVGAEVRVVGLGRHVDTDESGRFRVTVPPGPYVIEVYSPRFGRAVERVTLAAGAEVTLDVELEPVFHAEPIIASVGPSARTQSEMYQATDVIGGRDLVEKGRSSLGQTLAEARKPVKLNHPHCSKFCILGGASCSA